jgi:hypothetical protein
MEHSRKERGRFGGAFSSEEESSFFRRLLDVDFFFRFLIFGFMLFFL